MADHKKNPLFGAFSTPSPESPPGAARKPDEPPKPPADGKAPEVKKSDEAPKAPIDGKPPEVKKPDEPPKAPIDGKPPEVKKPDEPPKAPTDGKPPEVKKPDEPPKAPAGGNPPEVRKLDEPPKAPTDGKSPEVKKPDEPPKAPTDGEPPKGKKPEEPPKTPADGKAPEEEKPDENFELPKDFKLSLAPTEGGEIVTRLKLSEVRSFEGHPYSVKDDKDMWDLVESVKLFGVLEPATVIPRKEGGYEIISGHRRHRASELAGLTEMPVIIRNLDRDEAIISMVDANLKRENISPMEKARAYDMRLSAMQRKAGRRSKMDVLTGDKPKMAVEELSEKTGDSPATIKRLRSLVKLEPELQDMVEEKKLPVNTAADIAQLKPDEQKALVDAIKREDKVPSGTQAAALKEKSKSGTLTADKIDEVVAPTKKETDPELKVTFSNDELRGYFPDKATTPGEVKRVVFEALTLRSKAIENRIKKEAEEAARKNPPPHKSAAKQH